MEHLGAVVEGLNKDLKSAKVGWGRTSGERRGLAIVRGQGGGRAVLLLAGQSSRRAGGALCFATDGVLVRDWEGMVCTIKGRRL